MFASSSARPTCSTKMTDFKDMKLSNWLIKQCAKLRITTPTPVQSNCIPPILSGKDCIGCSRTGTGKTLAFSLPVLQKLSEDPYGIFALVLTATRELAYQIADQFRVMGIPIGLEICVIIGGRDMVMQGMELANRPHVVIATPGRLADHLQSCDTFSLKRINFFILDEADRLLAGSFDKQLDVIFDALPNQKQTLLFSATITENLKDRRKNLVNDPFFWSEPREVNTVDELDQRYVLMPALVKDPYLLHIVNKFLEKNPKSSVIIFTETCRGCQILSMSFTSLGFQNVALHSMKPQKERLMALTKFKSNAVQILLATDVASRGLDIPTVDLVINHNIPQVPEDYIHRVGRTARAGRIGMAITLVTQYDVKLVYAIEELIKTKLELYKTNDKEVYNIMLEVSVAIREAEVRLNETDFGESKAINKRKRLFLEGKDPEKIERKKQQMKKLRRKEKKKMWKLKQKQESLKLTS